MVLILIALLCSTKEGENMSLLRDHGKKKKPKEEIKNGRRQITSRGTTPSRPRWPQSS